MPTVYSWQDVDGPGMINVGASPAAQATAMINIFKACLVNGYPGKPAAGWELIYETDKILYVRNSNKSGTVALQFARSVVSEMQIFIMSDIPADLSGSRPKGVNMRSSVYSMDYLGTLYYQIAQNGRNPQLQRWCIVADANTFYFLMSSNELNFGNTGSYIYNHKMAFYVGELTTGQFVSLGGANGSSYTSSAGHFLGARQGNAITSSQQPATASLTDLITGLEPAVGDFTKPLGFYGPGSAATGAITSVLAEYSNYLSSPPYFPEEVSLYRPLLTYDGIAVPGKSRLKGLGVPLGLENLNYVYHYTYLTGTELTSLDEMYTPCDTAEFGSVIPFSGQPDKSNAYWLLLEPEYW